MSEQIERVKSHLAGARTYLDSVLDQVGDRWETSVYTDGLQWTVRQVVNHLAEADRGQNNQVMNIAEGKEIVPPDFDIERYNRRTTEKTTAKTADESRSDLGATRAALNEWLDSLDAHKLGQKGRHASLQIMTVEQLLTTMAEHERGHARDIARALNIEI